MEKTLKILTVQAGKKKLEVKEIAHQLGAMQKLVGGYLEVVRITDDIDMWLNEEGKLNGLPSNFYLFKNGAIVDVIVGDIFFASHDKDGETVSLTDEMIQVIFKRFINRKTFII